MGDVWACRWPDISIHALLAESDQALTFDKSKKLNFYPRSPCGERHPKGHIHYMGVYISIHALLAESDSLTATAAEIDSVFLSTLSLRRATASRNSSAKSMPISIHALLAESDIMFSGILPHHAHFYPRSPCGERPKRLCNALKHLHFYPRSPCGERQMHTLKLANAMLFLSTLSLRRATVQATNTHRERQISIHALLAESDLAGPSGPAFLYNFYPRSPCGERLSVLWMAQNHLLFLSTLSLRRATGRAFWPGLSL